MVRRPSLRRFPSYRNLLIYHELACQRRTQTAVADQFGVSQRRVSAIAEKVRDWVDGVVPPRQFRGEVGNRFHLAVARERIRLQSAYDPLLTMFTGDDGQPRYVRQYVAVVGGEALNTVEVSEKTDFRLLNQAVDVLGRLAELEAIAFLGPYADLPHNCHQTIVHRCAGHNDPPMPSADATNAGLNTTNAASTPYETSSNTNEKPRGVVLKPIAPPLPPEGSVPFAPTTCGAPSAGV
jgi:hypothetical protein